MLSLLVVCLAAAPRPAIPTELKPAIATLKPETIRAHMSFLASDLLEGRGTGARGHEIAAAYVASQFESFGLTPGGADGSWYQQVKLREATVDPKGCAVSVLRDGKAAALKWGDDFFASADPTLDRTEAEAPVVFVGLGLTAADRNWDDYAGADVKGKFVAFVFGQPAQLPSEEGAARTSYEEVLRNAVAHGAIGVVLLATPALDKVLPWQRFVSTATVPNLRWLKADGSPNKAFPEIKVNAVLSQAASAKLFDKAPKPFEQVLAGINDKPQHAFELPVKLHIKNVGKHRDLASPNVIGVLKGSNPKLAGEYVVISAHLDHLGIGEPIDGDSIYNGALDNASGSAELLTLARAFAALPKAPARSILFLACTAEEAGLLGSEYFAQQPTVPLKSIVADLNMDGASIWYTFDDVVAYGGEHTSLGAVVAKAAASMGLSVSPDPIPEQAMFVRSDHYSFVKAGIPSLMLQEGLKAKDQTVDARKIVETWVGTRYHAPSDDMKQPLTFDATIEQATLQLLVGYAIAQDPAAPTWNKGDWFGEKYGRRADH
jgi:hypothetical protein